MEYLIPLMLVALLVSMFFGVRRQKREAEKVAQMQDNLRVGDQVITTSGLYGTVVELDDATVDLEIAEEIVTTWLRQAIREVRPEGQEATESAPVIESLPEGESGSETEAADTALVEESADQTETRLTKE